jgi:hypothetical protein
LEISCVVFKYKNIHLDEENYKIYLENGYKGLRRDGHVEPSNTNERNVNGTTPEVRTTPKNRLSKEEKTLENVMKKLKVVNNKIMMLKNIINKADVAGQDAADVAGQNDVAGQDADVVAAAAAAAAGCIVAADQEGVVSNLLDRCNVLAVADTADAADVVAANVANVANVANAADADADADADAATATATATATTAYAAIAAVTGTPNAKPNLVAATADVDNHDGPVVIDVYLPKSTSDILLNLRNLRNQRNQRKVGYDADPSPAPAPAPAPVRRPRSSMRAMITKIHVIHQ